MRFLRHYHAAKINSGYFNPGRRFTLPWAELSKAFSLKEHKIQFTFLYNIATVDRRLIKRILLLSPQTTDHSKQPKLALSSCICRGPWSVDCRLIKDNFSPQSSDGRRQQTAKNLGIVLYLLWTVEALLYIIVGTKIEPAIAAMLKLMRFLRHSHAAKLILVTLTQGAVSLCPGLNYQRPSALKPNKITSAFLFNIASVDRCLIKKTLVLSPQTADHSKQPKLWGSSCI